MVRDRDVFVSASPRSLGHLFNRVLAVSFDGVHVYVALNVLFGNQLGQSMFLRRFNLAQAFTQLGRNVVQLQLGIDIFFRLTGYALLVFEARQAVFIESKAHLQSALT